MYALKGLTVFVSRALPETRKKEKKSHELEGENLTLKISTFSAKTFWTDERALNVERLLGLLGWGVVERENVNKMA